MNRSLTHSLPAKVAGIFLFILFAFGIVLCGVDLLAAYHYGIYEGVGSYYDSDACYSEMIDDLHSIYYLADNNDGKTSSWFHDPYYNNLRYAAYDTDTGLFLSNDDNLLTAMKQIVAAKHLEQEDLRFQDFTLQAGEPLITGITPDPDPQVQFTADGTLLPRVIQWDIDDWLFIAGIPAPLTAQDSYYRGSQWFDLVYSTHVLALILFVVFVFAAVADLIFLCCAAGHRYGKDEVLLNFQDKIPLDLYLYGVFWACFFLLLFIFEIGWGSIEIIVASALGGTGLLLLALATLLTLCTRFKVGKWWRNTIIYWCCSLFFRICRAILRGVRNLWHSVRMTWRVAAILAALSLLNHFIFEIGGGWYDAGPLLLHLCLNGFVLLVVCSIAHQMLRLKKAGEALAQGNFEQEVDTSQLRGELRQHGEHLNSLAQGLSIAVDQKMRSERMKTELITNVSHDIKTPLTSIINYVDLLQKDPGPEEQAEYLSVLDRQAKRLKKLTEDLVEASKASTGNLSVNLAPTNLREILDQAIGEYEDRLQAAGLATVVAMPEGELSAIADGRLLWRVLDNLLNNACKYAQGGTRVYLEAKAQGDRAVITMKNISRQQLNLSPDELMERFVRGDSSRNTEGSGLGLNIARSLIELQKGTFDLSIDGDLFKAILSLPLCPEEGSWVMLHD